MYPWARHGLAGVGAQLFLQSSSIGATRLAPSSFEPRPAKRGRRLADHLEDGAHGGNDGDGQEGNEAAGGDDKGRPDHRGQGCGGPVRLLFIEARQSLKVPRQGACFLPDLHHLPQHGRKDRLTAERLRHGGGTLDLPDQGLLFGHVIGPPPEYVRQIARLLSYFYQADEDRRKDGGVFGKGGGQRGLLLNVLYYLPQDLGEELLSGLRLKQPKGR